MKEVPRGIAVLDVGTTNTKLFLFDADLNILAEEATASVHRAAPPYRHIDADPVIAFASRVLPLFDRIRPVDRIVPSAHGSCVALIDATGRLALPIMDYQAEPPADIADAYRKIAPPFYETYAPMAPAALTTALQIYWQEMVFPQDFDSTTHILPWGQEITRRLTGRAVSEVTALGAQSQLWNGAARAFSSVAHDRGWAERFAPLAPAWDIVGPLLPRLRRAEFRGEGLVLAGIHDSSANFLRYQRALEGPFTLLSTGTWIIGFDASIDPATLDPTRDLVTNTTVDGNPVVSCRFMGGQEFAAISGGVHATGSLAAVARLIAAGTMALPSFTDSGGPAPGTGGQGHITGSAPLDDEDRASLAALYCAQMTALSLEAMGASDRIIVDGPFGQNDVYLACLAGLRPGSSIEASTLKNGTAAGAALLALADDKGTFPTRPVPLNLAPSTVIEGLSAYHANWQAHLPTPDAATRSDHPGCP